MKTYLKFILLTSLIICIDIMSISVPKVETAASYPTTHHEEKQVQQTQSLLPKQKQAQKENKKSQEASQSSSPQTQNKQSSYVSQQTLPKKKEEISKHSQPSIPSKKEETTKHSQQSLEKEKPTEDTQQPLANQSLLTDSQIQHIRSQFLQLINTTRSDPVRLSSSLIKSTTIRAEEASRKWSHTRPDGTRWNTTLNGIINIQTTPHGENLAQTEISSDTLTDEHINQIVKNLHKGLVNSPTHYQVMTNSNYKKVNIGINTQKTNNKIVITIAQHFIS